MDSVPWRPVSVSLCEYASSFSLTLVTSKSQNLTLILLPLSSLLFLPHIPCVVKSPVCWLSAWSNGEVLICQL